MRYFLPLHKLPEHRVVYIYIYEKLDHGIFKTFYWFSHYSIFNKSQYTISSKYGKRTRQLKFKKELKNFPSRHNGGQRKSLRTVVE